MTVYEIIGSILLIITCVLITVAVLFQGSNNQDGLSALGGKSSAAAAAEAKSTNAKLARITKVLAVVFFVITLVVYALNISL